MRSSLLITALLASTSLASAQTTSTTTFTLSNQSSAFATPVTATTVVVDTDPPPAVAPTITGITSSQSTTDEAPLNPFNGVVIADSNSGATDTLTITLSGGGGTLAGPGLSGTGPYTITGTPAAVTSQLQALVFTPAKPSAGTGTTPPVTVSTNCTLSTFTPNAPASCGYVEVFNDPMTSSATFCMNGSSIAGCAGSNWYLHNFIYPNGGMTPVTDLSWSSAGTTMVPTGGANWEFASATVYGGTGDAAPIVCQNAKCAAPTNNTGGSFSGTTFYGGWYAKATITFTATNTNGAFTNGWPAWWSSSIEWADNAPFGGVGAGGRLENDMMEFEYPSGSSYILATDHLWPPQAPGSNVTVAWGEISNDCCKYEIAPANPSGTVTHTYSQLWIAGQGLQNYIDGVPTTTQGWVDFACNAPPSTFTLGAQVSATNAELGTVPNNTFAVGDCQHAFIIFGGQEGVALTVKDVEVWQLP